MIFSLPRWLRDGTVNNENLYRVPARHSGQAGDQHQAGLDATQEPCSAVQTEVSKEKTAFNPMLWLFKISPPSPCEAAECGAGRKV